MANPFDSEEGTFCVLVNAENQHSLWPAGFKVPLGWSTTGPSGSRKECLEWIDKNWTDIRPKSLIRAMEKSSGAGKAE